MMRMRTVMISALLGVIASGCGDSSGPKAVATVQLSPSPLQLQPGESATLTATPRDADGGAVAGRSLVWSSSNPAIATVSATGLVSGVADGTATVTATAGNVSGTAAITVRSAVSSVTLTPPTAELIVGRAPLTIVATPRSGTGRVLTDRVVQWSSSAPTVATVSTTGVVTAVSPGQTTISATSENTVGAAIVSVAPDPCGVVRTITIGQPTSGTMRATDCMLSDSTAVQRYAFTLTTRTKVEITMSSGEVDAYLFVLDSAQRVVVQDDDGGGGRNARILRTLAPGRYELLANVFDAKSYGTYQLALLPAPPACVLGRSVALPTTLSANLDTNACRQNDGSFEDRYEITVTNRGVYRVGMSSRVIDPIAVVLDDADRVVAQDDDSGDGDDAFIEVQLDPGRYTLLARAYPGQTGAYTLSVGAAIDPCAVNRVIAVGQVLNSTFTRDDCALSDGGGAPRYLQRFGLVLNQQTTVQLDMTSTVVDSYLILQNAQTGVVVAQNDDIAQGTPNSRILVTLPAGSYIVNTTTYNAGETGAYRLSLTVPTPTNVVVQVSPGTVGMQPGQTQQLSANVSGASSTGVAWSSSDANVASVTVSGVVRALTLGTARITATSVADPTRSAFATITVGPSSSGPNLDIAALYLVQSVQQLDGRIPLVADRQAMARVFVRSSVSSAPQVPVRVRIVQNGSVVGTYTGNATPTLAPDESCCSANIMIPSTVLRAGAAIIAEVDPENAVAEANETDNVYPLNGQPLTLNIVSVPPFNIRMIPVQQARNGPIGEATVNLFNVLRSVWPLGAINATVRTPLAIDYTIGSQTFDDWIRLVRDVELVRQAEGGADFYYGLVRTSGRSGVLGLANGIPARTAIGVDEFSDFGATEARLTFAHEMGHVLGLRHAPCGGAAGPDPNFPFTDGRAGVWGMDTFFGNTLMNPSSHDIMTYCPNQWVSAYHYRKVLDFRQANPTGTRLTATQTLLISGAISRGVLTVDPAFSITTNPAAPTPSGRYVVEGFDASDAVVFSWAFDPYRVDDAEVNEEAYVVAVPLASSAQARIVRLVVRERNGAARSTRTAVRADGAVESLLTLRKDASNKASIAWSPNDVPAILVRSRTSGDVVAIARRGALDLSTLGDPAALDILASDGTRSTVLRVDVTRGSIRR